MVETVPAPDQSRPWRYVTSVVARCDLICPSRPSHFLLFLNGNAESNPAGVSRHPLSSQASIIGDRRSLENITDWRLVVKQYLGTATVSK